MKSFRRIGVIAAVTLAAAGVLSACDKPVPLVTVLANNTATQLTPQVYCFDPQSCRKSGENPEPVKARAGSTISIDVPKSVADKAWLVSAYSLDDSNKATAIEGAGTTLLHDQNNARINVPFTGTTYYIAIQQTDGKTATGIWQAAVQITGSEG
ncbi:uncharacterized protein DUF2771 [Jatrophihabitans sp. GAS493]|uniref:DUF2771 family protein n=1 Tax=Jatrophihabitans sp. GAS493 TaxID=1907575 RepID=UPI000BC0569F|nr:DUF2771 family protein [Jatrophihabitans sp. GAS493]SOD70437.1 uncharacterized protein DUF2771 [Jatrophihabitans sp. GAS493]